MSTTPSISQVNLDKFRASSLFSGIDGKDSTIVVIDTGANLAHPLLADRVGYREDLSGVNDSDVSASNYILRSRLTARTLFELNKKLPSDQSL